MIGVGIIKPSRLQFSMTSSNVKRELALESGNHLVESGKRRWHWGSPPSIAFIVRKCMPASLDVGQQHPLRCGFVELSVTVSRGWCGIMCGPTVWLIPHPSSSLSLSLYLSLVCRAEQSTWHKHPGCPATGSCSISAHCCIFPAANELERKSQYPVWHDEHVHLEMVASSLVVLEPSIEL